MTSLITETEFIDPENNDVHHVLSTNFIISSSAKKTIKNDETTDSTDELQKKHKYAENQKIEQNIIKQIEEMKKQIEDLTNILYQPQIITIHGTNNLPAQPDHDWREKIFDLFYNARLPMFWIIDLEIEHQETDPVIHIAFINFAIKEHVLKILTQYLTTEYSNKIFVS